MNVSCYFTINGNVRFGMNLNGCLSKDLPPVPLPTGTGERNVRCIGHFIGFGASQNRRGNKSISVNVHILFLSVKYASMCWSTSGFIC